MGGKNIQLKLLTICEQKEAKGGDTGPRKRDLYFSLN